MARLPIIGSLLFAGAASWLALSQWGVDPTISDTIGCAQVAHQLVSGDDPSFLMSERKISV